MTNDEIPNDEGMTRPGGAIESYREKAEELGANLFRPSTWSMTNDEIPNDEGMTKHESRT